MYCRDAFWLKNFLEQFSFIFKLNRQNFMLLLKFSIFLRGIANITSILGKFDVLLTEKNVKTTFLLLERNEKHFYSKQNSFCWKSSKGISDSNSNVHNDVSNVNMRIFYKNAWHNLRWQKERISSVANWFLKRSSIVREAGVFVELRKKETNLLSPMKLFILEDSEAVAQRFSVKKEFLEISHNSQENTCARVSFIIKLQASGVFLWILWNF